MSAPISVNVNPFAAAGNAAAVAPSAATATATAALLTTAAVTAAGVKPAAAAVSDSKSDSKSNTKESVIAALPAGDVTIRKSGDRGHAEHGWLNSYHTFSFSSYQDARYQSLNSLRVINEDRVAGGEGFGSHPHSNFEIFSYVVGGALSHRDSMGNREILPRGSVQFTSAGSGIQHSEFNADQNDPVAFLQMWIKPHAKAMNVKPSYQTRFYSDAQKVGQLRAIVSPAQGFLTDKSFIADQKSVAAIPPAELALDQQSAPSAEAAKATLKAGASSSSGGGHTTIVGSKGDSDSPAWIHNDARVFASILEPKQSVSYAVAAGRDAYVHVVQDVTGFDTEANLTGLTVNGVKLSGGDGAFLRPSKTATDSAFTVTFTGAGDQGKRVEFLLFDLKRD